MESVVRRCEFCETSLSTDVEVSIHLMSNLHKDKVNQFNLNQPQNPKTIRNPFKNIIDVFKALRLRTVCDVKDLADARYFRIPDEDVELTKVSNELSTVMLNCLVGYISRSLDPNVRKAFLGVVRCGAETSQVQEEFETEGSRDGPDDISESEKAEISRHTSPPLDPVSAQSRATRVQRKPTRIEEDSDPVPSTSRRPPDDRPIRIDSPRVSSATSYHSKSDDSASRDKTPSLGWTPNHITIEEVGANQQSVTEGHRDQLSGRYKHSSSSNRSHHKKSKANGDHLGGKNQPEQILRLPSNPETAQDNHQSGSSSSTVFVNSGNPFDIPPNLMPMSGASMYIPQTSSPDGSLQPRLDSTYKPQLARVKVEPKDE